MPALHFKKALGFEVHIATAQNDADRVAARQNVPSRGVMHGTQHRGKASSPTGFNNHLQEAARNQDRRGYVKGGTEHVTVVPRTAASSSHSWPLTTIEQQQEWLEQNHSYIFV